LVRLLRGLVESARWSSGQHTGFPIAKFRIQIPTGAEIWIEIFAPPHNTRTRL